MAATFVPARPYRNDHKVADLYGTVRVVERGDGYFFFEQRRHDDEPHDEKFDRIAFSRETMEKLHATIGAWLNQPRGLSAAAAPEEQGVNPNPVNQKDDSNG